MKVKKDECPKIEACLKEYGMASLEEAREICLSKGHRRGRDRQRACSPSAFENAVWAYTLGAAIALKKGLQERRGQRRRSHRRWACRPSASPARWPNSAPWALATATWAPCFCATRPSASAFLAGHESFAAAEGAIGIARTANKARKEPLRVILNGLGKDAAYIISRINGFTYVETDYDFARPAS